MVQFLNHTPKMPLLRTATSLTTLSAYSRQRGRFDRQSQVIQSDDNVVKNPEYLDRYL